MMPSTLYVLAESNVIFAFQSNGISEVFVTFTDKVYSQVASEFVLCVRAERFAPRNFPTDNYSQESSACTSSCLGF